METWRKYVNTAMLTIVTLVVSVGAPMLNNTFNNVNDKLDSLLITVTVHNSEAEIWKQRIEALEAGNHQATVDRITREEVMKALDDMKEWVDKYYARK
jgi:hypothetical protein